MLWAQVRATWKFKVIITPLYVSLQRNYAVIGKFLQTRGPNSDSQKPSKSLYGPAKKNPSFRTLPLDKPSVKKSNLSLETQDCPVAREAS